MPKVTEAYKQQKKEMIIKSALQVLQYKALYELTMIDVIKQANLSKGGIYLYFSDIDELIVAVLNAVFEEQEELCLLEATTEGDIETKLVHIFGKLGDYMEFCSPIVAKMRYELSVYLANNPDKMEKILQEVKFQKTGAQFMTLVEELIHKGVETKVFQNHLDLDVIMRNISIYLDGMTDFVTRMIVYNGPKLKYAVRTYCEQYIKAQISQWN